METNLIVFFSSEGANPSVVAEKIKNLGFKIGVGKYDLVYSWDKEPSEDEILALGDKVTEALKGDKVSFKLESK